MSEPPRTPTPPSPSPPTQASSAERPSSQEDKPDKGSLSYVLQDTNVLIQPTVEPRRTNTQQTPIAPPQTSGPPPRRPFVCPECGSDFKYKHHMQRHIATIHEKQRPHACDFPGCGRTFGLRENMIKHRKMVHENLRPYPCTICNTRFKQREHLTQHLAKHRRDGTVHIEEQDQRDEKRRRTDT